MATTICAIYDAFNATGAPSEKANCGGAASNHCVIGLSRINGDSRMLKCVMASIPANLTGLAIKALF